MSKRSKIILLVVLGLLVLAGGGYYVMTNASSAGAEQTAAGPERREIPEFDAATADGWINDALVERSLGKEDATVTMHDYSSLTCPHCASFHLETLPQLKKDYIDTGKLRLVFADFPLNLPALQASGLARCIKDNDAYFAFIDQLFRTQAQWGGSGDTRANLLGTVKFTGLTRNDAARCIDSAELSAGILKGVDAAQKEHEISSTPSFVLTNKKGEEAIVRGAETYEVFKAAIDGLLK